MSFYIDCGSGVAGDMLLGALIGLGLSPRELEQTLQKTINEKGWKLVIAPTERQGWPAWSLKVQGDRPYGSVGKMKALARRSALPTPVKEPALAIFNALEQAEKDAHGHDHAHFDPAGLGLLDTVVDVLGCAWGFWKLGITKPTTSILNTGRIAPATAALLQRAKIPAYSENTAHELATPTGVAILSILVKRFESLAAFQIEKAGYGAGSHDRHGRPNVLAIYRGESVSRAKGVNQDTVVLLETVIDDMDPRLYPHVMDLLLKQGALDTWWAPIGMKKGRPGIAFSVLCLPDLETKLLNIIFQETTTLGVRRSAVQRWTLPRTVQGMTKVARLPGRRVKSQVEFELAKAAATRRDTPLRKLL